MKTKRRKIHVGGHRTKAAKKRKQINLEKIRKEVYNRRSNRYRRYTRRRQQRNNNGVNAAPAQPNNDDDDDDNNNDNDNGYSPPPPGTPPSPGAPPAPAVPPAPAPPPAPPAAPGNNNIYCGNTRIRAVQQGLRPMGTRKSCYKKGIQIGRFVLPPDVEYARAYLPLDNRRIYCGNSNVVPANHILGKLPWCLSKGIGKGKRARALQHFGGPQP